MKICRVCKYSKADTDFFTDRSRKDGLANLCKPCTKLKRAQYPQVAAGQIRVNMGRNRAKEYVCGYLHARVCVDCGEHDPRVLEFDHVTGVKIASISQLVTAGANLEVIRLEIEKCEVRCANCHRRITQARAGYARCAVA